MVRTTEALEEPAKETFCEPCALATGVGLALNVCDAVLKPAGTDCDALKQEYDEGKIDESTLFDTLIQKAKPINADVALDLEEIKRLAGGGKPDEPEQGAEPAQ